MLIPWLRLAPYLALVAALAGATFWVYDKGHDNALEAHEKAALEAIAADAKAYQEAAAVVHKLAQRHQATQQATKVVTKEIIREVRIRIPASDPPLSGDWRVLHDSAATGAPAAPTSGTDAATVSAQDAAETVAENYGQYHELAERLRALQEYVKGTCR